MNTTPKWLTRAGTILVMMAFLLPTVSCTVLSTARMSFSLYTLANGAILGFQPQTYLYLIPFGALITLVIGFFLGRTRGERIGLLLGQMAGLGVGVLCILGLMLSLPSGTTQLFEFSPDIGFFVLLLGYALAAVGIAVDIVQGMRVGPASARLPVGAAVVAPAQPANAGRPRLELIKGDAPSQVPIPGDDFLIGRSQRNNLVLNDRVASGMHVRLRYAQGAWFIQDQNSSNGTFVNGKRVAATRLHDGDEILVGKTAFIFHT